MQLLNGGRLLEIATLNGGSVLSSESQTLAYEVLSLRELALKLTTGIVSQRGHEFCCESPGSDPSNAKSCQACQEYACLLKEVFKQYPAFKTKSGAY
jgi:hypothetical protein